MTTDQWVTCSRGHSHWGSAGAAGLLLVHDDEPTRRFLLQHRSHRVQHGGTWSIPGGALRHRESVRTGARREAAEELGRLPALADIATVVDDHGGWSYTTVIVRSSSLTIASNRSWEVGRGGHSWFTASEIQRLRLHPGFAATWLEARTAAADR